MNDDITFPLHLSVLVASCATVIVAIAGTAFGYLLARVRFPGRTLLDTFCMLPLVLPPTVVGYYLLETLGRHGWVGKHLYAITGWTPLFTWQAAVIASCIIALPIMVKTSKSAIESLDKNYELVAYTLGKSRFSTICTVTLPLASRGILAGIALSFARALGEFGATLMVAGNIPGKTQTMPLAIYQATQTGNDALANTLVLLLTVLSLAILFFINKLGSRW
jgi:molybdate transport system permease protein